MDRSSGGFHSFHKNLLCEAFKEIGYPLVSAMSDTIVVNFVYQTLVRNLVESLGESNNIKSVCRCSWLNPEW